MSGLILPKAVFDLHVTVSSVQYLSDHVHGKILGTMSVSDCIPEKFLIWIKCQRYSLEREEAAGSGRSFLKIEGRGVSEQEACGGGEAQAIFFRAEIPTKLIALQRASDGWVWHTSNVGKLLPDYRLIQVEEQDAPLTRSCRCSTSWCDESISLPLEIL